MFALNCLSPTQFALALKDCGNHEIVSCEEHDDQHFIVRHVKDTNGKLEAEKEASTLGSAPTNEEHDSTHQIEKFKQGLATIPKACTGLENFTPFVAQESFRGFEASFITKTLWPNAPPDPKNTFLSFLPSVRLQV